MEAKDQKLQGSSKRESKDQKLELGSSALESKDQKVDHDASKKKENNDMKELRITCAWSRYPQDYPQILDEIMERKFTFCVNWTSGWGG
ncbi:hypothetical protein L195_g020794 [Trifolium pratense]|uniref:Uncharacterized protein n=1 Tax=Trifolium pratense TaxID=57577 RepID=A0A2K3N3E0_TRIPR|nr:hypothetical protein L195_g020794 [Trifolium pratense]